jgi:aspartate aminotransferase
MKGIICKVPKGTFYIFCDVSQLIKNKGFDNSDDVVNFFLEEANVATVSSEAFGYENFVRMSFANSIENIEKAMDRIEEVI